MIATRSATIHELGSKAITQQSSLFAARSQTAEMQIHTQVLLIRIRCGTMFHVDIVLILHRGSFFFLPGREIKKPLMMRLGEGLDGRLELYCFGTDLCVGRRDKRSEWAHTLTLRSRVPVLRQLIASQGFLPI